MKTFLKWTGIVLGGLVALLLVVGGVMYWLGGRKVDERFEVQTAGGT